jgi:hypothetical protein
MTSTVRNCVVALVLMLILIAGGALGSAQTQTKRPIEWGTVQGGQGANTAPFVVLSGPDIGFRVGSQKGNSVRIVVRVNSQWADAETPFAPKVLNTASGSSSPSA